MARLLFDALMALLAFVAIVPDEPAEQPAAAAAPRRPRAEQMDRLPEAGAEARAAGEAGYLGIVTGAVPRELQAHLELPERSGLLVTEVAPGSPASAAGLRPHDVILGFGGREVSSPLDLVEMVEATRPGTRVKVTIVRRGRQREVAAVLTARPPAVARPAAPPGLPFDAGAIAGLPRFMQEQVGAAVAQAQAQALAGGGGTTSVQSRTITVNGRTSSVTISTDEAGTIEVRTEDGRTTVAIRAADGTAVHAGPLDADADLEAIPEAWRQRVRDAVARARGAPRRAPGGPAAPF